MTIPILIFLLRAEMEGHMPCTYGGSCHRFCSTESLRVTFLWATSVAPAELSEALSSIGPHAQADY